MTLKDAYSEIINLTEGSCFGCSADKTVGLDGWFSSAKLRQIADLLDSIDANPSPSREQDL